MYREALAIRRDALGKHHRDYIVTLSSLTSVLVAQEKKEEAEQMMREAVTLTRDLWDEPHPLHARTLNSLGNFLREQGATEEASALLQESVAVWRATVPTHPYAADAFLGWGQLLLDTHQPQRAEPLLREALAIRTTVLPADHWKVAQTQSTLGACLTDLQRYAEAEPLLKTSYATLEKERGPDQPETQRARRYLAHLYEAWDKPEQAVLYRATASNS
jgi:tetratricopeptide (TPR) repeat protein